MAWEDLARISKNHRLSTMSNESRDEAVKKTDARGKKVKKVRGLSLRSVYYKLPRLKAVAMSYASVAVALKCAAVAPAAGASKSEQSLVVAVAMVPLRKYVSTPKDVLVPPAKNICPVCLRDLMLGHPQLDQYQKWSKTSQKLVSDCWWHKGYGHTEGGDEKVVVGVAPTLGVKVRDLKPMRDSRV
uniref:Uncharacterized protein n=1 Tax=Glossina austeni TaxID=7395 RepID=A0A1A9VII9_GLOAU